MAPPEITLHYQLARLYEDLLDVHPIGIKDDFFALGGHSLLAARLVDRIAEQFGKRIALTRLFNCATIERLATILLEHDEGAPATPLVEVQTSAVQQAPIVFLHGDLEGGGFYCRDFARHLAPDRTFYALPPHGVHGEGVPLTIEAMARDYLTVLRAAQPHGPYVLGGFCGAALVAFEMARQLRAQGEATDLVVMINPTQSRGRATWPRSIIRSVGALAGISPDRQVALFLRFRDYHTAMTSVMRQLRSRRKDNMRIRVQTWLLRRGHAGRPPRPVSSRWLAVAPLNTRREELFGRHVWAEMGYRPRRYDGRVLLIWSSEGEDVDPRDPSMGWRRVAPRVAVSFTPGSHLSAITTHIHAIAGLVERALRQPDAVVRDELLANRHEGAPDRRGHYGTNMLSLSSGVAQCIGSGDDATHAEAGYL